MSFCMSATFKVEGYPPNSGMLSTSGEPVEVTLETDGVFVMVTQETLQPALTPKGWRELADCAQLLLNHANNAWAGMGAQP